jgi:general secretion pathway protein G
VNIVGTGRRKKVGILAFSLLLLLSYIVLPHEGRTIAQAREIALEDNLYTMRSLIRDYTAEQRRRPESLHDLIATGYLKQLPKDPFTDRRDTWTVEWSSNPTSPGIVNVRSGASGTSSKGSRYNVW